jgi:transposase
MSRIYSPLQLAEAEAEQLRHQVRSGTWLARDLARANILLMSNERPVLTQAAIASRIGCSVSKVQRTQKRYREHGLQTTLHDQPRPGTPNRLTPEHEAFIVATACTDAPEGTDHWTVVLLNQKLHKEHAIVVGNETVRRVLLRNNLKPWLKKNVVHSETGQAVHRANA